jgi:pyruvate,water dikinase
MYVFREAFRSELTRGLQPVRALYLELASRFVARGWLDCVEDSFFLMPEEMIDARAKSIARARRLQREAFAAMDAPLLIRPTAETRPRDAAEPAAGTAAVHNGRALRGLCVSRGVVEGTIAVLRDASEGASMPRGAILVTVATDPSWTPLFTLAAGVITEIGGTVSHAATLARELGVPALANVRDATTRLRDGMRVRLDATGGVVTILD